MKEWQTKFLKEEIERAKEIENIKIAECMNVNKLPE